MLYLFTHYEEKGFISCGPAVLRGLWSVVRHQTEDRHTVAVWLCVKKQYLVVFMH